MSLWICTKTKGNRYCGWGDRPSPRYGSAMERGPASKIEGTGTAHLLQKRWWWGAYIWIYDNSDNLRICQYVESCQKYSEVSIRGFMWIQFAMVCRIFASKVEWNHTYLWLFDVIFSARTSLGDPIEVGAVRKAGSCRVLLCDQQWFK